MENKKRLAVLGSTGSVGQNTLDLVTSFPDQFSIEALVAGSQADLLIEQALKHRPNAVVIGNDDLFNKVSDALWKEDIKVYAGKESIEQILEMDSIDMVVNALSGNAGLLPSLAALNARKPLALANKESLVIAGPIVIEAARKNGVPIIPIDSEPSALFQCMAGETQNKVEKMILTASGGPFLDRPLETMKTITAKEALNHPVWSMGNQISVDSATLMNKGWEIMEVKWLFDIDLAQIDVVIHPQAIVHSMVQFEDGSIKAQLSLSDMKIPILYAISYPFRMGLGTERFNFFDYPELTFDKPDTERFPCLQLAIDSIKIGGNAPCGLLAANQVAVQAFLEGRIPFTEIPNINNKCLHSMDTILIPSLNELIDTHKEITALANSLIEAK